MKLNFLHEAIDPSVHGNTPMPYNWRRQSTVIYINTLRSSVVYMHACSSDLTTLTDNNIILRLYCLCIILISRVSTDTTYLFQMIFAIVLMIPTVVLLWKKIVWMLRFVLTFFQAQEYPKNSPYACFQSFSNTV